MIAPPQVVEAFGHKMTADEVRRSILVRKRTEAMKECGDTYPTIHCPRCGESIKPLPGADVVTYYCEGTDECEHCHQDMDCTWEKTYPKCFARFVGVIPEKGKPACDMNRTCQHSAMCAQYQVTG